MDNMVKLALKSYGENVPFPHQMRAAFSGLSHKQTAATQLPFKPSSHKKGAQMNFCLPLSTVFMSREKTFSLCSWMPVNFKGSAKNR